MTPSLLLLISSITTTPNNMPVTAPPTAPIVIAHRGDSAHYPEHTQAAYLYAIEQGADCIEPDLVSTADGVMIARHENEIGSTTDIAKRPEFADRKTRRVVDGKKVDGWFSEDFTLAEIKTLRARERLSRLRGIAHDGQFQVLTLDEIIALVAEQSAIRQRPICLIPEIKHPSYFQHISLGMEEKLLETVQAHPYTQQTTIIIQSFEITNLKFLRQLIIDNDYHNIQLLQLIESPKLQPYDQVLAGNQLSYADMLTPEGLNNIAQYADIIGPQIRRIIPFTFTRALGKPTSLVSDAHATGLKVMPYTFRPENLYLARNFWRPHQVRAEGSIAEINAYLATGIDGFFTDDIAAGRQAVDGD